MVDVHVIGAGIGGLTAAVGLCQRGLAPAVHEAAAELRPVGGGIVLGSNALAALERLDLATPVRRAGTVLDRLRIVDPAGRPIRRHDFEAERAAVGQPYVYLHRAALQRLLVDRLPADRLHLGETCTSVEPGPNDARPIVRFAADHSVEADAVIGADGIDSVVRSALVEQDARRETGTIAYRGVVDVPGPDSETVQVWGSGTRVGVAPLGDDRTYWFATHDGRVAASSEPAAVVTALRRRYRAYPAPIPRLLARTDPSSIVATPLSDVAPLSRWHGGGVALLGDAAHAPLPYLGQGAGQAIEDAVALSRRLPNASVPAALAAYERTRKSRAERITRLSRLWWRAAQLETPLAEVRNALVRRGPAVVARRQQRWLATPAV